jgi:hypothetical protein
MTRKEFYDRYCDAAGKRFTILNNSTVTREELRLMWQDLATLKAEAMTSAPCDHGGGRYLKGGFKRCAICMQPVEAIPPEVA